MIRKCIGCGANFQCDNKNKIGYIRKEKIDTATLCERCFKIRNYGELIEVESEEEEYIKIYKEINKTNDLVLFLVDIFNINNSINLINKYINNKVVLVITKYDIIPKSVNVNKIKSRIKEYNFNKNIVDIILVSSFNNYNIDLLYDLIYKYKDGNIVYVTGNSNAGKSTLINPMLMNYSNNDLRLTTSILPSTTINVNKIDLNDDITFIDTPGFIEKDNISMYLSPKELKKVMPNSEIRPITYQLEKGKTLLVDKLLRIEYVNGDKNSFTFYISNDIIVSRINTITNSRCKELKMTDIYVNGYEDIVINGLCFIKIIGKAHVKVYTVDGVGVYTRKSLI